MPDESGYVSDLPHTDLAAYCLPTLAESLSWRARLPFRLCFYSRQVDAAFGWVKIGGQVR